MSRFTRIGRTLTSCVGKGKTINDDENVKLSELEADQRRKEDQQNLFISPKIPEEFYERVRRDAIAVEVLECFAGEIRGVVSVRNDAPEKRVTVRYTTDDWETYQETTAEWLESIEGHNCDKFGFSITSLRESDAVYLAVRYDVLEQQYWDNNNNSNYAVIMHW